LFSHYGRVFRTPGTKAFCAAGFIARMPIAIYPLGFVLLFSNAHGDYGVAGLMTGVYIIAGGIGSPLMARLVDRLGQDRVLVPAGAIHVLAGLCLVVMVHEHVPDPVLAVAIAVMGLSYLSIGSLIRARWSYALADPAEIGTAYSLESTLDEAIFTIGPIIASVLATLVAPTASILVAAALVAGGTVWLQSLSATVPPIPERGGEPHRWALAYPGMVVLTGSMVFMGAVFGGVEVTMAAFTGQHGNRGATGVVLACFALGSVVAGLVYGARQWTSPLPRRYLLQTVIFAILIPVFLLPESVLGLAVAAAVVGLGIAPVLIAGFGLVDRLVPASGLTEGLSWVLTGLNFGYGASAAVSGAVADRYGAHAAFLSPAVLGVLLVVIAAGLLRRLRVRAPVGAQ
jgi:MFS family permease